MVMRFVSLSVIAALAFAPGCLALAVPPAVGFAGGVVTGTVVNVAGGKGSIGAYGVVGGLAGVAVDVIIFAAAAAAFSDLLQDASAAQDGRR
jgi:hypothetical protein